MPDVRHLQVQLLTEETFAPYGKVVGALKREPDFRGGSGTQLWDLDCEIDGTLQLGFVRVPYQPLRFKLMEQHYGVMQTFIPLGGPPCLGRSRAANPARHATEAGKTSRRSCSTEARATSWTAIHGTRSIASRSTRRPAIG